MRINLNENKQHPMRINLIRLTGNEGVKHTGIDMFYTEFAISC